MIYRNGKLMLQVQKDVLGLVNEIQQKVQKNIGAIYKGSQLVWLTVYAIKSCFGSGTWIQDRPWLQDDTWKNT